MDNLKPGTRRKIMIDIVIPNYNGKQFLDACLTSIFSQTFSSFVVFVIDNGSDDGSADFIQRKFPKVRLISLTENKGFSAAVNTGIQAGESPFIFLLNNDTELAPDCLEQLVAASEKFDEAFFAPKMLSFSERTVLDGAGDGFLRGGVGYRLGTMEKDGFPYDQSVNVFGACGGAAFYRRSMLEKTGLFDEDFFAYLEDVDLNFRANRAGFSCRYIPGAKVYHIGSATTGSKINTFTVRLTTRNNFFLIVKNYPLSFFVRFFPAMIAYQFCWLIFVVKKRQFLGYCSGVIEFIRGFNTMAKKRQHVSATKVLTDHALAKGIIKAERDVVASIMRRRSAECKGNSLLQLYSKILL